MSNHTNKCGQKQGVRRRREGVRRRRERDPEAPAPGIPWRQETHQERRRVETASREGALSTSAGPRSLPKGKGWAVQLPRRVRRCSCDGGAHGVSKRHHSTSIGDERGTAPAGALKGNAVLQSLTLTLRRTPHSLPAAMLALCVHSMDDPQAQQARTRQLPPLQEPSRGGHGPPRMPRHRDVRMCHR